MNAVTVFLSEPIVERFGWALVHSLWQCAAITALLAVALPALRNRSPGARYFVACCALIAMLAAPAGTLAWLSRSAPAAAGMTAAPLPELPEFQGGGHAAISAVPAAVELPQNTPAVAARPPAPPIPWKSRALLFIERNLRWMVVGWLAGVTLLAARLLVGFLRIQRIRRRGVRPAAPALEETARRLALKLGLRRAVLLLESTLAEVPTAIGWLRPVILLPASLLTRLTPLQLEAILAHELAHIRRHDYLVNLFQTVAETLLFYHPAVHWASRRIRQERELCCDDLAVALCGDTIAYVRALAELAELPPARQALSAAATGGSLLARIQRLLKVKDQRERLSTRWLAGAVPAVILIAVLVLGISCSEPPANLGRVVDVKGKGISGVKVEILKFITKPDGSKALADDAFCTVQTDAKGRYPIPSEGWYPGPDPAFSQELSVRYSASGYVKRGGLLIRQSDGTYFPKGAVAEMHRMGAIEGILLGPDGKPLANAQVTAGSWEEYPHYMIMTGLSGCASTDGEGRFHLDAPPGRHVVRNGDSCVSEKLIAGAAITLADGETRKGVVLDLSKSVCAVAGTILDAAGKPVAGAKLVVCWKFGLNTIDAGTLAAVTGPDGHYQAGGLPPGPWYLRAYLDKPRFLADPAPVQLEPGRTAQADLRLSGAVPAAAAPASPAPAEKPKDPLGAKSDDYSAMLKLYPEADKLRMPTAAEIEALGPLWPTIPPEENAAYYYALAASLVRSGAPMGSCSTPDAYAGDKAAFAVWIRDNEPAFDVVRKGLACKVCMFPPLFDRETNRVYLGSTSLVMLRNLSRTISDAAFLEELNNRPEAAADWHLADIRIGRQMGSGTLMQNLVGIAIESLGTIGLDRLMANAELPAPALRRIIEKAREAESSTDEMKDLLAYEEMCLASRQGNHNDLVLDQQGQREMLRSLDIPLHVYLAEEAVRKAMEPRPGDEPPGPVADCARERSELGKMDVRVRVLQIRAAIALFQKQTGRLPEKLDELVPAILPSVPLDAFNGKPLRYARTDDGWKVWGVGFDLKDHGGTTKGTYPFTMWTEGDAVFPSKLSSALEIQAQRSREHAQTPQANNRDMFGLTPLHYAANRSDAAEVARLLAAGADVNAKGNCSQTPLHLAGTATVAKLLLEHGADLNAKSNFTGSMGLVRAPLTPLGWAIFGDRKDVVQLLLDANAVRDFPGNSNALQSAAALDRYEIVTLLVKKGESIQAALTNAVHYGNVAMARKLLSAGAVIGAGDFSTALRGCDWEMAEFCLAQGAKLDIFNAAALGKLEEAGKLLAADPSLVKQVDTYKWTALHWAAFAGRKKMVALLISKGADVNQKESGETPLHVAVQSGFALIMNSTASHEARGESPDPFGTVQELLDNGADVNARNASGQTPLILSVCSVMPFADEALLKKGADVKIKDDSGKTALDWAKQKRFEPSIKLLEEYGAK